MLAACLEESNIFNMLVENRRDIYVKDNAKNNLLIIADSVGNLHLCQTLSETLDVNYKNYDGYTVLMWAAINGYNSIIEFLVYKGADINMQNNYGKTSLMNASNSLMINAVETLLLLHADITLKDNDGKNAIDNALEIRHSEKIVELLKKHMPK